MAQDKPADGGEFDVRIAWRRDDPAIEADAIALWNKLGILPPDVKPEARAKQLAAAAYQGGRLAALCTGVIEPIAFLRARFVVMRSLTDPDFRRSHAQVAMAQPVMSMLEQWAAANPEEKVAGLIGFVEPGAWGELARMPIGPFMSWTLVAYTHDGQQVRAVWFDHCRIEAQ